MKELMYCMESAGIFVFACFRELTVSLTTNTMQEKKLTATVRVRPTDEKQTGINIRFNIIQMSFWVFKDRFV